MPASCKRKAETHDSQCVFSEIHICTSGSLSCCCRFQTAFQLQSCCKNHLVVQTTESSEIFCSIWTRQRVTSVDLQISAPSPDSFCLVPARPGDDVSDWRSGTVEHFFNVFQDTSLSRGRLSWVVAMQEVAFSRSSTVVIEGWRWSAATRLVVST